MAGSDAGSAVASQSQSSENDPTGMNALDQPNKRRGRPPGSKNKAKPSVAIEEFSGAIRPLVLEMKAGSNIIDSLQQFWRRTQVGISVLIATGSVTNVTLRQAGSVAQLQGIFEMKNLSGCFLPPSWNIPSGVFSTTLQSPQLWIEGEIVGNHFIAAGAVSIVLTQLTEPAIHNLDSIQENNTTINGNGNGSHGNRNVLPSSAHQGLQFNNDYIPSSPFIFQTPPGNGQTWPLSADGYPASANGHPHSMP